MQKNLVIFLIALNFIACATSSGNRGENDDPVTDGEAKTDEPILEDANLPVRDVLEEGFCYDDIYGEYLRDKYFRDLSAKSEPKAARKIKRSAHENESLFYARSSLVGPLPPDYGALPITANHEVEFWIRYFKTRGRSTFMKWLVRAESYRELVQPILKSEGLPEELVYLAMVESGFSNAARSSKRATGTWQFMSGTALLYDLKINHWVDERRDPVKSTLAAARYLRDLYEQFGDWYLAMAAYNAGPGKVRSAIRRSNSRDFWKISTTRHLRKETKHYVPKVLAALNLATHSRQNGFDLKPDPADLAPKTTVKLEQPVQIRELAQALNLSLQTVKRWNPELIHDITPPSKKQPYELRLPDQLIEEFYKIKDSLSLIEVTDVLMHKVRPGETLSQIARRYNVKIGQIQALNPHIHAKSLRIGKEIAIPIPGIVTKKPKESA